MTDADIIDVRIIPRSYTDLKSNQSCYGSFVIIQFIQDNKVRSACSAIPRAIYPTPQAVAYERAAFLRRANQWV